MTRDVQNVIDAANDPEVPVLVLPGAVTRKVTAFDFTPIDFFKALGVAPNAAKHIWPRLANYQLAARVSRHRFASFVDDFDHYPEQRQRGRAGFSRSCARQRRD